MTSLGNSAKNDDAKGETQGDLAGTPNDRIAELEAKCAELGRELNRARYGEPDFAWSVHRAAMENL
jgi:hypothetical protein